MFEGWRTALRKIKNIRKSIWNNSDRDEGTNSERITLLTSSINWEKNKR